MCGFTDSVFTALIQEADSATEPMHMHVQSKKVDGEILLLEKDAEKTQEAHDLFLALIRTHTCLAQHEESSEGKGMNELSRKHICKWKREPREA